MSHEKLKALIERARQENKVLYCSGNNQYYTPADMDNLNSEGKCLWAVERFELADYNQLITSKYEKPLKFESKGIIYLPVIDIGNTRVITEEISFWYYDKKAMQTMVHLKSMECLRVQEDIETVDQKIMDSKGPAIGKELADFWYDIIVNGIHHNGKGLKYEHE